jgi:UDP-GlcNAc:undecaprenyl-phosphate GlcNAc-1-phosphate transferase
LPLAALPVALLLSFAVMPLFVRLAWATGWLDHPEARKLHTSATALLGGVAVFAVALTTWAVGVHLMPHAPSDWEGDYLLFGAAIAMGLGLWDDRYGMQPAIKMLGQASAATMIVAGGAVPDIGLPHGIEAALTLVGLVGLMNAVNFLDNMNGMVGGLSAIALLGFAWTSMERGANGIAAAQLALAGACLGFLPHNFPRASIFLGDAGSLLLGYSLGASALLAMKGAPPGWGQAGPVFMLAYPAFDLIFVVVTRLRDGRPVQQGGKDHTNHRLASVLKCPIRTVLVIWLSGAALCAGGLVMVHLNRPIPTLLLWGPLTILLCWSGLRLSSVPIAPPSLPK